MADEKTDVTQDTVDQSAQPAIVKDDSAFRDDTLGFIKSVQQTQETDDAAKSADTVTEDTGSPQDDTVLPGYDDSDIPDAFSDAAEKAGMTPVAIVEFAAAHSDEELLELIPKLLEAAEPEEDDKDVIDKTTDKVHKDVDKDSKGDDQDKGSDKIDPDMVTAITEKISKQLEEKFGVTLKEIETFKASQEEQSTHKTVETVSKKFDEAFKEFPVFGKTEELPKFPSGKLAGQFIPTSPAMKARMEVLKYADAFMKMGANIDNAMDDALATYKGKHLTKEMERKLVKDLKGRESKLSGARTGKETTKKYADTREEIIDEIRQMQKAHGLES